MNETVDCGQYRARDLARAAGHATAFAESWPHPFSPRAGAQDFAHLSLASGQIRATPGRWY